MNEKIPDPFEIDGQWYVTKARWARTHRDFKDTKKKTILVNGGGRGTILVPVTIIPNDDPRIPQQPPSA